MTKTLQIIDFKSRGLIMPFLLRCCALALTTLLLACGGGGGGGSDGGKGGNGNNQDTTPNAFSFIDQSGVARGVTIESNAITVSGVNTATPISIIGGEYSIDGGNYTSVDGTVIAGQTVTVRQTSSTAFSYTTDSVISIGDIASTFSVTTLVPNFIPDKIISDHHTIFILSRVNRTIFRWSITESKYLNSISVGHNQLTPTHMAHSSAHNRLYLGYSSGSVRYIDLSSPGAEQDFIYNTRPVTALASTGNHLLIQKNGEYGYRERQIVDIDGTTTDDNSYWYYATNSNEFAWSPTNSRIYFLSDNYSSGSLHYQVINQTTGHVTSSGETPYYGSYHFAPPIRVSANGQYVLLGSGDIFNSSNLTRATSIGNQITDALWLSDDSLVTLLAVNGATTLQRHTQSLRVVEQINYAGQSRGIYGTAEKMAVLVLHGGALVIHDYTPNDDSDGDGVNNTLDAFPLDPAASVDSDNDGYPDFWNPGYSQADSTTGLTLDAYPNDAACYLPAHGDGVNCNYGATVPNYTPDQIVSDGNIIYLLSSANKRVYRWSITDGAYINPLVVGYNQGLVSLAPSRIAHSPAHNRLYLAYTSGAIRYIDLTGAVAEQPFANVSQAVRGLAAVGNYVLAQDDSGAWESHHIFDVDGVLTDSKEWNHYSREYAWSPSNSRVYFFRDNSSPNDLLYAVINQTTGKITSAGETPYHGSFSIMPPIRVSADGQYILLGSGDIYNGTNLNWAGSLGSQIADAMWLPDGSLITLLTQNNNTSLQRRDASLTIVEQISYTGQALGIYGSATGISVAVMNGSAPAFYNYVANDDSDGDGVNNTLDAFPLDPAASVDSDNDGYPDFWNPGYSQADSTTGLTLDAYPNDAACYLPAHGDGVNCNYGATVPNYTPDQIVSDGNIIYLLSSANKRVYRWSIADGSYINPLVVGYNQGFSTLAPTHMAYSAPHKRLYLGYNTGAIQYIDLEGAATERAFANTAVAIGGIASAGNYLLAQDGSGAWATHYIFDANGALTDKKDWNYYSRTYAWSQSNSRAYFFRDNMSPNDLHYEVIDQSTGKITSTEETPYHGAYSIMPPIRLSEDESEILIGSGHIFNAADLTWSRSLGSTVVDAIWLGTLLVTVDSNPSNSQVKLRNKNTLVLLQTLQYAGSPISLIRDDDDLILVHVVSGRTNFTNVYLSDQDGDGLPKWWEDLYGLSDDDPTDAGMDDDFDGLTNLEEFINLTHPGKADTDGDGLTDGEEVNIYFTDPTNSDSDGDGLSDGDEVLIHGTDPNNADSDGDSFSDFDEVMVYLTDPNNSNSVPPSITSMNESFEGSSIPGLWVSTVNSHASWMLDSSQSFSGSQSLRSGTISHNQQSAVKFSTVFTKGTLRFYAKVDSESCCDQLTFYVDGELTHQSISNQWTLFTVELTSGAHELEWRYTKDSSVSRGADAVWIDDVSFVTH